MLQDLRNTLRMFARNPGFLAMVVLTLGLGIGANTTIFSAISAYLLRPLPSVQHADRLVVVDNRRGTGFWSPSYPDFLDWKTQNRVFEELAAYTSLSRSLTGDDSPERLTGARVSLSFFSVFTAQPSLGRVFLPDECRPVGEAVILISHGLWQRRFGGNPRALGQSLILDGVSHKIVGVMPRGFRFSWTDFDFWSPLEADAANMPRGRPALTVVGRRKSGASLIEAQVEMNTIASRLSMQYPETNAKLEVRVRDLVSALAGGSGGPREPIYIMMGVVVFVLLIACANVANLQLARAAGRLNETAVRVALGAGRWRIVRQLLTESLVAAALGCILGAGLSLAGTKILIAKLPSGYQPISGALQLDLPVLVFTAGMSAAAGLLSGLAPAFQVTRMSIDKSLRAGGRSGAAGARSGLRSAFVVVEVSLATILLLAAGLLLKSYAGLLQVDPGFRTEKLLTANIRLPDVRYAQDRLRSAFFDRLVEHLNAAPGIQSAAVSTTIPTGGMGYYTAILVEGKPETLSGQSYSSRSQSVSPGYFKTLGMPLRRGRIFTGQDAAGAQPVVIISEGAARAIFPNEEPLGRQIKWGRSIAPDNPWMTVVGVVGDVTSSRRDRTPILETYAPIRQRPSSWMYVLIRTHSSDPYAIVPALRSTLRDIDRDLPIGDPRSMQDSIENGMTVPKFITILLAIFAAVAMAMAAMGVYGVVSYSVGQRTREFGLRMALGAPTAAVIGLVLRQAVWLIAIGVAIGVPAAAATTSLLRSYLVGVDPRDPVTFVLVPAALAAVALFASYVPARRATRVDPVTALRYE